MPFVKNWFKIETRFKNINRWYPITPWSNRVKFTNLECSENIYGNLLYLIILISEILFTFFLKVFMCFIIIFRNFSRFLLIFLKFYMFSLVGICMEVFMFCRDDVTSAVARRLSPQRARKVCHLSARGKCVTSAREGSVSPQRARVVCHLSARG